MSQKTLLFINYGEFRGLNKRTGNWKFSLSAGRIAFQVSKTRLEKGEIARTMKQVADSVGVCETTAAEQLQHLEALGLIKTRVGMWWGNKRTFISCREDFKLGFDAKKLSLLNKYTGGDMESITLSLFAFFMQKNPLHYRDGDWVMVAREEVRSLFGICDKTAVKLARDLEAKGIIEVDTCRRWGKEQFMVKISNGFCAKIEGEWAEIKEAEEAAKAAKELAKREKVKVSLRLNNDPKVEINNNNLVDEEGIIILSKKEQNYLRAAVMKTIGRMTGLGWQAETLIAQVKYAMSNDKQRKGTQSFGHAINRAMFLIRKRKWKEPFGWRKYTLEGKMESERERLEVEEAAAKRFTKKGPGTIQMYDYGIEQAQGIPASTDIFVERNRLQKLALAIDEINQALQAKFGEYAKPHLLRG